jgi:hypothetical protein
LWTPATIVTVRAINTAIDVLPPLMKDPTYDGNKSDPRTKNSAPSDSRRIVVI